MPQKHARQSTEDVSGLGAAILDAFPVSLYVVDRRYRIVAWNALRETGPLGLRRKDVLGRSLWDVLSPHGRRTTLPVLRRVFETATPHEVTTETPEARIFQVRRWPVFDGPKVTHVLNWFDDITERRVLEMRLIASDRLAFLGQLVAGVAHEVSNPLAGIAGCAEVLASLAMQATTGKRRREAREFRALVRTEVARCERIVRSLLDSARPEPGSSAAVGPTVGTTLRLLERHPAFARIKVVNRVSADLPQAKIDPDSLKQVVMALATNAARAMPGGGTLRLAAERVGHEIVLDVQDTGPGVPRALRSRIFEPFFTTDTAKGAGLGLAIARSLVRGRGGDLVYRPRPRGGASFRVLLEAVGGRR